jgi:6-phosphogluconolactonase (cycloisomerase 2 family)
LDLSTGELAEHPATSLSSGSGPVALAFSSDHKYLFVANSGTDTFDTFEINSTNGELTPVASRNSFHPNLLGKIAVDPLGRFLWSHEEMSTPGDYQLVTYKIENDGSLTYSTVSNVNGGAGKAINVMANPSGTRLYVNVAGSTVYYCTINSSSGGVTSCTGAGATSSPNALVYNATASRLFSAPGINDVTPVYVIDGNDDITNTKLYLTDQPFPFDDIAVNGAGDRMYMVSDAPTPLVKSYTVTTTSIHDSISLLNSVTFSTGCAPKVMASLMDDDYLITACTDGSGQTFSLKIESDGSLTKEGIATRSGMKVNSIVAAKF